MLNLRRSDIPTPRPLRPETPLFAHLPFSFVGGIFAPQCSWLTRTNHIRAEVPKPHLEGWVTTLMRQNVRKKLSTHHARRRCPAIFSRASRQHSGSHAASSASCLSCCTRGRKLSRADSPCCSCLSPSRGCCCALNQFAAGYSTTLGHVAHDMG